MDEEELSFIRKIEEYPDDDAIRLVMADWYEERGETERAEFIRVQLELAELDAIPHTCGTEEEWVSTCSACGAYGSSYDLRTRQDELFARVWNDLVNGIWADVAYAASSTAIRIRSDDNFDHDVVLYANRGFVDVVHAPISDLEKRLPSIVRRCPIEFVVATDLTPWVEPPYAGHKPDTHACWWDKSIVRDDPADQSEPPEWLFEFIWGRGLADERKQDAERRWLKYPSVEVANDCLSEGLIEWAKQQPDQESSCGQQPERIASD